MKLLLETIRSRAPILRTDVISDSEIDKYLCSADRRAAQLKLSSPKEFRELISVAGESIGKAIELLEPKTMKPIRDTRTLVSDFVCCAVESRGAKEMLPIISRLSTKRDILERELSLTVDALRDLILLKKSDDAPLIFYCDRDDAIELCDKTTLSFLYELEECVSQAIEENKRNANVRLMLLKMAVSARLI